VLALLALLAMLAEMRYYRFMATLTIRNVDETVKRRLQVRAALNGRSMEAELRATLSGLPEPHSKAARARVEPEEDFGTAIRKLFAPLGGVELDIPPRQSSRRQIAETVENVPENVEFKDGLGTAIHNLFAPLGGVELVIPPRRKSHRMIPTFK
jgi:plasmid stability protein